MTKPGTHESIAEALKRTQRLQAAAAEPEASVWVSANAGTGKTHVLTMRVLRLMLAGTPPERILCLTYTKAAAAEMSKRVFASLAKWVMLPHDALEAALSEFLGRAPDANEIALARTLFTRATETPGGLRVQTIHAFAERLLQRFPLEAGVTPGFAILDEETARSLRRDAIDEVLARAANDRAAPLGRALKRAVVYAAEDRFDDILADALANREWIEAAVRMPPDVPGGPEGLDATQALYEAHFAVRSGGTREEISTDMAKLLSQKELEHLHTVLRGGSKTDVSMAEKVSAALAATTAIECANALSGIFLKSDGDPREKLLTNALKKSNPELEPILDRASTRFVALWAEALASDVVQATMALLRLASEILQRYSDAKVRRAALDFDDLIVRTRNLLLTPENAQWVLYKLDNGLDHILVDESQDTSPPQWQVVEALASEFFSGHGTRDDTPRTVFAVGDEKQSIYSFQGAAPKMFADTGQRFEARAKAANVEWQRIPLNVSFRTVAPILDAVDTVFSDEMRTPGVGRSGDEIRHVAKRFGQAGLVEIWPTEKHADVPTGDAWAPLEEQTAAPPVVRLANRIADTIKHWLANREELTSEARPIEPGDILILVRKRPPFAAPMVQALKARGIPVAGADRMRLTDQIAVEDLLSLGDFLTLPEDDLALAEVLKSPIFGFDDDDLLTIAHGRKRTLWKALLDNEDMGPRFKEAATTLKRWRKAADFRPPFEFFADLLDRDGVRAKLIARLGPDAADPLDEFLNLALTFDDSAPPSLSGFLTFMRNDERMIKRDMEHGRNEVRVMTVHGSKGLEAPIVFLADTCAAISNPNEASRPMKMAALNGPAGSATPFVWPVKGTSRIEPVRAAREDIRKAEREEYNRLLYVAMTRARDRLYVAGFEGKRGADANSWYRIIADGLAHDLERVELADGSKVLRLASPQTAPAEKPKSELAARLEATPLPSWAEMNAPREPQLSIPLAPSRFAPYETDDEGEPRARPTQALETRAPSSPSPAALADESRFLRGTLTHALLEHLPALPARQWSKAAGAFVSERGKLLSTETRRSIVAETIAILKDPTFAAVFGPGSRAEVPIVAVIPRPDRAAGPALRITGQIDRLAELPDKILIVDFKTNRGAPPTQEQVAPAYLYQLAAYRLALREIYGDRPVEAALLWTDGARLMKINATILDEFADQLWRIDPASLDG